MTPDDTRAPEKGLPPLRRFLIPAIFVAALFAVVFLRGRPEPGPADRTFRGPTMGTSWTVKVVAPALDPARRARIQDTVQETVDRVDNRMSTYKPDSELSRLNRHGTGLFDLTPELANVLFEARRIHRLTRGAFDITVGPLVNAYGFGPDEASSPPSEAEIGKLLEQVGQEKLILARKDGAATALKKQAGLYCDLSGIAKGYAVDQVSQALERLGYHDYMVEIGGEVRTKGRNGEGRVWRIGVEKPDAALRTVRDVVPLLDSALATSGEYRNFYEVNGVRYSHTIDPRTGRPIGHRLASVSVLHESCMTADALATAMNVLGPDEGYELAVEHGLAVLFIQELGDGSLLEHPTPAFEAAVLQAESMTEAVPGDTLNEQGKEQERPL